MADYRIICTTQEPKHYPREHQHIVSVGTGVTADTYTLTWTVGEVIKAIKDGWHTFHTIGRTTGKRAEVAVALCPHCSYHEIIKTVGDWTTDNNLDYLPECG